ncbi:hypothetical protein ACFY36_14640 [Actinoplanes sp. NPDC000266]
MTAATPAASSAAGPPEHLRGVLDASTWAEMRYQQDVLRPSAQMILERIESEHAPGFTNVGYEGRAVVLWWKGALPASVAEAVKRAERIAPVGVRPAAYSRVDLDRAAERVLAATAETGVNSVAASGDGSGLRVTWSGRAVSRTALSQAGRDARVPVTLVEQAPAEFMTRGNDGPPWWGGARVHTTLAGYFKKACTSGFGVRDRFGAAEWLVSAAHCASPERCCANPAAGARSCVACARTTNSTRPTG